MKDQIRSLTSLPCAPDGKSDPTVLVKNLHETKFSSKSRQGIYLRHFPTKRKVKGISLHISVAQKESREATRRDQDSKRQNENYGRMAAFVTINPESRDRHWRQLSENIVLFCSPIHEADRPPMQRSVTFNKRDSQELPWNPAQLQRLQINSSL